MRTVRETAFAEVFRRASPCVTAPVTDLDSDSGSSSHVFALGGRFVRASSGPCGLPCAGWLLNLRDYKITDPFQLTVSEVLHFLRLWVPAIVPARP